MFYSVLCRVREEEEKEEEDIYGGTTDDEQEETTNKGISHEEMQGLGALWLISYFTICSESQGFFNLLTNLMCRNLNKNFKLSALLFSIVLKTDHVGTRIFLNNFLGVLSEFLSSNQSSFINSDHTSLSSFLS